MKLIIFGTGSSAIEFISKLDSNVEIVCYVDNNPSKHNTIFNGRLVLSPERLLNLNYDYIIIGSQYSEEIMEQLLEMGIRYTRIIPAKINEHLDTTKKTYDLVFKEIIRSDKVMSKNKKLKIAITNYNYSHSNGFSLYRNMPEYIQKKYDVNLITEENKELLRNYDVICSSNHDGIYDGNHINIELWHGFPIKRMGIMHEEWSTEKFIKYQRYRSDRIDLIMSYSHLYTTFYNSCFPNDSNKYRITGMPRNDLLFDNGSFERLQKICNRSISSLNVVFYFPTWRKGKNERIDSSRTWNGIFGFQDESTDELIKFIEQNNILLVVKLHPFEYNDFKDLEIFKHKQVYLLSEEVLTTWRIHLYQLLSCAKLLITDYSSIFFDMLLLDVPFIFTPTDVEEYEIKRGFLVEPYNFLTPGPTVLTFSDFKIEVLSYLNGNDPHIQARNEIKKVVFKYTDHSSSLRVWNEIDTFLTQS